MSKASGTVALRRTAMRLGSHGRQVRAAAAVVISVVAGVITNLVTGQHGWALVAGVAALVLLGVCWAAMEWFQEAGQTAQSRAGAGPRDHAGLGSVAPPWGLLPARVCGRHGLIENLWEWVASPDGRVHVLSGLGGNGKTTVALAVARKVTQADGQAWWLSARDRASLDSGLLDLAGTLGVSAAELEQARTGRRSVLDLVWQYLAAASGLWVLVVDNADSPELLAADGGQTRDGNGVARASARGLTLVTSRNGDKRVWGDRASVHVVGPLEVSDAADVLLDLSGPAAGDREEAIGLAQRLGCLPLALRAVGHYLSSAMATLDGLRTFGAYRDRLDARFTALQGPVLPAESDPRDIVMATWEASLDLLAAHGHLEARGFMRLIGQFAPAPVPIEILNPATLSSSGLLRHARRGPRWLPSGRRPHLSRHALNQVIAALADLGLLDLTDYVPTSRTGARNPSPRAIPCLVTHPLVAEVNALALAQDKAQRQKTVITVVELVAAAAQKADPRSPADAAIWPLLAPHIGLLTASAGQLPATAAARFAIAVDRVAMGLRHGGDYTAALHCLTGARQAVSQLEPEHPAVLALQHSYAYVIDDLGRFAEAEAEYRKILAARGRTLGPLDPLTLGTRNHLGYALGQQRRFREAEAEYRQVLQARRELLGSEHPDTLTTQNNLADALYGQRRYGEAAEHYQQVLNAQLRTLGPDHLRTLTTRNNLARNRDRQGDHIEAEKELRAVLELRRDSRGPEHPSTLTTQYDLATSLASQRRLSEARSEFESALEGRRRVLGENHPDTLATARALNNLTTRKPHPDHAEN